jgi:hypothetical protein
VTVVVGTGGVEGCDQVTVTAVKSAFLVDVVMIGQGGVPTSKIQQQQQQVLQAAEKEIV